MTKQAEIWECDVCGGRETAVHFPKEWFKVNIKSGSEYYGMGDNRNVHEDCCSKDCIKKAVEPLIR